MLLWAEESFVFPHPTQISSPPVLLCLGSCLRRAVSLPRRQRRCWKSSLEIPFGTCWSPLRVPLAHSFQWRQKKSIILLIFSLFHPHSSLPPLLMLPNNFIFWRQAAHICSWRCASSTPLWGIRNIGNVVAVWNTSIHCLLTSLGKSMCIYAHQHMVDFFAKD